MSARAGRDPVQSLANDRKGGEPVRVLADRSPVYVSGHNSTTARAAARGFAYQIH
jgi:hypothetical protein